MELANSGDGVFRQVSTNGRPVSREAGQIQTSRKVSRKRQNEGVVNVRTAIKHFIRREGESLCAED